MHCLRSEPSLQQPQSQHGGDDMRTPLADSVSDEHSKTKQSNTKHTTAKHSNTRRTRASTCVGSVLVHRSHARASPDALAYGATMATWQPQPSCTSSLASDGAAQPSSLPGNAEHPADETYRRTLLSADTPQCNNPCIKQTCSLGARLLQSHMQTAEARTATPSNLDGVRELAQQ